MLGGIEEQLPVDSQGGSYSQPFTWTPVDFISNGIELLLAVDAQVLSLWHVLAHQAVHVFIGAPLPGAVRIAEVHRDAGAFAQLLVHGHLPALVVRHAQAHGRSNAQQLVGEGLQHVGGAGRFELGQLDQHDQSAGALHQGAHGAGVGRTLDEVALPVPRELPILDLGWANVDAEHVGYLAAPILPFAAWHSLVVGMAQSGNQFFAQLPHGLGIDAVVDGLV